MHLPKLYCLSAQAFLMENTKKNTPTVERARAPSVRGAQRARVFVTHRAARVPSPPSRRSPTLNNPCVFINRLRHSINPPIQSKKTFHLRNFYILIIYFKLSSVTYYYIFLFPFAIVIYSVKIQERFFFVFN